MVSPAQKSWCFTINNYTDDDCDTVKRWVDMCSVLYCAKEVGAENGTPHLQGYMTMRRNRRLSGMKKLHPTAHWEIAKGAKAHSHKYLFVEKPPGHGTIGQKFIDHDNGEQGTRSDLIEAMDTLRKHGKKRAMEEHTATVIRHAAHLENGLDWFNDEPRDPAVPPYVIWVVGPPGAGKSRWVYDTFGSSNIYNAPATLNWFDGY